MGQVISRIETNFTDTRGSGFYRLTHSSDGVQDIRGQLLASVKTQDSLTSDAKMLCLNKEVTTPWIYDLYPAFIVNQ